MPSGQRRWYDARQRAILPGREVAYNLSGDVALGEVVETGLLTVKIRLLHPAGGFRAGHISTVKRPYSILVLRSEDGARN